MQEFVVLLVCMRLVVCLFVCYSLCLFVCFTGNLGDWVLWRGGSLFLKSYNKLTESIQTNIIQPGQCRRPPVHPMDGWMDGRTDGCTVTWTDRQQTDEQQTGRRMEGWTAGRQTFLLSMNSCEQSSEQRMLFFMAGMIFKSHVAPRFLSLQCT